MSQYNNNSLAELEINADINKSFAAFADLEPCVEHEQATDFKGPATFGEFAPQESIFPMI